MNEYRYLRAQLLERVPSLTKAELDSLVTMLTEDLCRTCMDQSDGCYCSPAYDV